MDEQAFRSALNPAYIRWWMHEHPSQSSISQSECRLIG